MKQQLGDITTITIAHRLSTIQDADRIIVLAKGKIVEDGNHASLLKDFPHGTYSKLVSQQEELDQQTTAKHVAQHAEGGEKEGVLEAGADEAANNDPEVLLAKEKMKEAEALDKAHDDRVQAAIAAINDPKKQKGIFKDKIKDYNKPIILSVIGVLTAACIGLLNPVMGALMMKATYAMLYIADNDSGKTPHQVMNFWAMWMAISTAAMFIFHYVKVVAFGYVAENITENMRRDVY